MSTLTLQRPRWVTPSSSRHVEELPGPSGLPPQASIAGCLSSKSRPEEWRASLERLGRERSQVGELQSRIPAQLEESLFEELASALLENYWIGAAGDPRSYPYCVFLTTPHHGAGLASAGERVYLVQLKRISPEGCDAGTAEPRLSETWESVVPDTNRVYTVEQMAKAWNAIGRPISEDDVPLSIDPDDYPLF